MLNFFKGMRQGTLRIPDFVKTIHKPTLDIRQKEIAMNYAMSFIRPIDKDLEDVIVEVATSNKIRMNIARGKEMIN